MKHKNYKNMANNLHCGVADSSQLANLFSNHDKSWLLQTRATRCETHIKLYTKVDAQCDKLATDDNTCNSRHTVVNQKFQREVPLFLEIHKFSSKTM